MLNTSSFSTTPSIEMSHLRYLKIWIGAILEYLLAARQQHLLTLRS